MKPLYKISTLLLSLVILLTLVAASCSSTTATPTKASPPATTSPATLTPDSEKVLNMYVAYGQPELVAAEFEKKTGIKVQFLTMSSGEVLTRLQAEKANPQTDVWFGGR
jgi:ABC-type glycerol-3-phosphate transport system substrate-binding protein